MKIGEKTFVSLSYTLRVAGEVVDSAPADNPLKFVYGAGYLLPKFEEQIKGLGKGDKFEFTLTPAEGYGETMTEAIVDIPKTVFMVDGAIEDDLLIVGNQIPMSTADGQHLIGVVKEVTDESVKMDFNHPMAGKTLDFSGEIVDVREATDADYMNGMAASGCNCGDCGDGCGDDCDCEEEGEQKGGCSCGCC